MESGKSRIRHCFFSRSLLCRNICSWSRFGTPPTVTHYSDDYKMSHSFVQNNYKSCKMQLAGIRCRNYCYQIFLTKMSDHHGSNSLQYQISYKLSCSVLLTGLEHRCDSIQGTDYIVNDFVLILRVSKIGNIK